MQLKELFDEDQRCIKCQHSVQVHGTATGEDGALRMFCSSCPSSAVRVMGDEGTEFPIPFFIEMSFGSPEPCFEEKPAKRKVENFLPRPSGFDADYDITLRFASETGSEEIRFSGMVWRIDEIEQLQHGDHVQGNLVYKRQLYWDQEGLCPGCGDRTRFDNMEMDRLIPGSAGGEYIVGNVQLLCVACNRVKGNRDMEYLKERRRSQGLLN